GISYTTISNMSVVGSTKSTKDDYWENIIKSQISICETNLSKLKDLLQSHYTNLALGLSNGPSYILHAVGGGMGTRSHTNLIVVRDSNGNVTKNENPDPHGYDP